MRLGQQVRRPLGDSRRRRAPAADRASRQPGRGAGDRPCHAGRRVNRPRARPEPRTRAHSAPSAGIAARMPSPPGAQPGRAVYPPPRGRGRAPPGAGRRPGRQAGEPGRSRLGCRLHVDLVACAGIGAVLLQLLQDAHGEGGRGPDGFRPQVKAEAVPARDGDQRPAATARTCTRAAGPGPCPSAWPAPGAMRSSTSPPHARGLVRGRNKAVNSPPRLAPATVTRSHAPPAGGRCPARDSTSTSSSPCHRPGYPIPVHPAGRSRAGAVRRRHHDQPADVVPAGRRYPPR